MSASLPRTIYDFFIRKWFLSSILLTLSTGWLSLIQIFGKTWGFVDDSGDLKESICYVTWFFVFISVVFALLKTIADKYNEDAKNNGQYVLEKLLQSMNSVTTKKMNRFIDFIASAKDGKLIEPFLKITQPREQIISILENIQITLSDLFGISRSEIGISIIYKHNTETNWDWLIQLDVSGDLTLDQILNNPSASARQIIDNKKNILFYADKRVGRDAREYLPAPKDPMKTTVSSPLFIFI